MVLPEPEPEPELVPVSVLEPVLAPELSSTLAQVQVLGLGSARARAALPPRRTPVCLCHLPLA